MVELFANSGDPDQTPRSAASDLGLHCLLVTRLGISSLQWVKVLSPFTKLKIVATRFLAQISYSVCQLCLISDPLINFQASHDRLYNHR